MSKTQSVNMPVRSLAVAALANGLKPVSHATATGSKGLSRKGKKR